MQCSALNRKLTWKTTCFYVIIAYTGSVLYSVSRTTSLVAATAEACSHAELDTKSELVAFFQKADTTTPWSNYTFIWWINKHGSYLVYPFINQQSGCLFTLLKCELWCCFTGYRCAIWGCLFTLLKCELCCCFTGYRCAIWGCLFTLLKCELWCCFTGYRCAIWGGLSITRRDRSWKLFAYISYSFNLFKLVTHFIVL